MKKSRLLSKKGFTLVECLVALCVFASMASIVSLTINMIVRKQSTNIAAEKGLGSQLNGIIAQNAGDVMDSSAIEFDILDNNGHPIVGKKMKIGFDKVGSEVKDTYALSMIKTKGSSNTEKDYLVSNVPFLHSVTLQNVSYNENNGLYKLGLTINDNRNATQWLDQSLLIRFPPGYEIKGVKAIATNNHLIESPLPLDDDKSFLEIKPNGDGSFAGLYTVTLSFTLENREGAHYGDPLFGTDGWFGQSSKAFKEDVRGSGNYVQS